MQLTPHAPAKRLVNHLVLLHAAFAGKGLGYNAAGVMVAIAAQILDHHSGVRKGVLDQRTPFLTPLW